MKTLSIRGTVFSGSGEGTKFTEFSWAKKQITEKLGFKAYPGTLNLRITEDTYKLKALRNAKEIEILPPKGFYRGKCFKAAIDGVKCAIIIPEIPNYPENMLEIVAPLNLRERFKLKDGDTVEVTIML